MPYLRYSPDIETLEKDEQETIDGIIKGMTQQSEVVEKREHHAVRASHAKSSACVVGEMTIAGDLPPELAQGLFARAGLQGRGSLCPGSRRDAGRSCVPASGYRDQGVRSRGREASRSRRRDAGLLVRDRSDLSIRHRTEFSARRQADRRIDADARGRQKRSVVARAQPEQGAERRWERRPARKQTFSGFHSVTRLIGPAKVLLMGLGVAGLETVATALTNDYHFGDRADQMIEGVRGLGLAAAA